MTRLNFTRWTCNVCGTAEEMEGARQPEGWVGYGFTERGTPAGEQRAIGHLCPACHNRVVGAMEPDDLATPAPSPDLAHEPTEGVSGWVSG